MKTDEFAFFNQQLAAMLRDGIPLEGALKQLCAGMSRGALRTELQTLETDLARGVPLRAAVTARALPQLYVRMVSVGALGGDLPGVLTLLADHYHQAQAVATRLKGLLVYPAIVILASLGLSLLISKSFFRAVEATTESFYGMSPGGASLGMVLPMVGLWMPPILFALLAVAITVALVNPRLRAVLRWRLPSFRDAALAEFASAMALMLKSGSSFADALALAESLEDSSPAAAELALWRQRLAQGTVKIPDLATSGKIIPPLFTWLVSKAGEDPASGFARAAEIYRMRALQKIEMALYAALPMSVLFLGVMIFTQVWSISEVWVRMLNMLGGS